MLKRVSINKDLLNYWALRIDVFKLFWSDVLSLRELEDILCTINNLNSSIRINKTYITRTEPAIFRKSFFCSFWVLKISLENIGTLHLDFSSRRIIC
jgi:hypothetical protein